MHLDHSASILGEDERTIADTETKWRQGEQETGLAYFACGLKFVSCLFIRRIIFRMDWNEVDRAARSLQAAVVVAPKAKHGAASR